MDYIHPDKRVKLITESLQDIAQTHLEKLFNRLIESKLPNVSLVGDYITVTRNNGRSILLILIPIYGKNNTDLCKSVDEPDTTVEMAWQIYNILDSRTVLCTPDAIHLPLSVKKIIAWATK